LQIQKQSFTKIIPIQKEQILSVLKQKQKHGWRPIYSFWFTQREYIGLRQKERTESPFKNNPQKAS
jgi:hypothetical protein